MSLAREIGLLRAGRLKPHRKEALAGPFFLLLIHLKANFFCVAIMFTDRNNLRFGNPKITAPP
jgi:hypothetical protein